MFVSQVQRVQIVHIDQKYGYDIYDQVERDIRRSNWQWLTSIEGLDPSGGVPCFWSIDQTHFLFCLVSTLILVSRD